MKRGVCRVCDVLCLQEDALSYVNVIG